MVTEFNELLISIVGSGNFDPIFHVDSRGLANPGDWYDEIHLEGSSFRDVASLYVLALRDYFEGSETRHRTYSTDDLDRARDGWKLPLRV
jgi:hypothetical protein